MMGNVAMASPSSPTQQPSAPSTTAAAPATTTITTTKQLPPSTVETPNHPHLARDGLWYATYTEMREANVRMNERRLQELGLVNNNNNTKNNKNEKRKTIGGGSNSSVVSNSSSTTHSKVSLRKRKSLPEPVRRSHRTSVPAKPIQLAILEPPEPPAPQKQKLKARQAEIKGGDDWDPVLREELRLKFQKQAQADMHWLDEFRKYWKDRISEQNFKTILRQVEKLADRHTGITYKQWPPDVMFPAPNSTIDMSTDFEQLYTLANEFERRYGEDKGHGWLVKIPLKKLLIFQRFYLEGLLAKASESASSIEPVAQKAESVTPFFPVGTTFEKKFTGYGIFEGRVESYDPKRLYYKVHYPLDGDSEELTEAELKKLKILSKPTPALPPNEKATNNNDGDGAVTPSESSTKASNEDKKEPRYPIGTKFAKTFLGHGTYVGRIESFDGVYYKVVYPKDGDREDLTESELDSLVILSAAAAEERTKTSSLAKGKRKGVSSSSAKKKSKTTSTPTWANDTLVSSSTEEGTTNILSPPTAMMGEGNSMLLSSLSTREDANSTLLASLVKEESEPLSHPPSTTEEANNALPPSAAVKEPKNISYTASPMEESDVTLPPSSTKEETKNSTLPALLADEEAKDALPRSSMEEEAGTTLSHLPVEETIVLSAKEMAKEIDSSISPSRSVKEENKNNLSNPSLKKEIKDVVSGPAAKEVDSSILPSPPSAIEVNNTVC